MTTEPKLSRSDWYTIRRALAAHDAQLLKRGKRVKREMGVIAMEMAEIRELYSRVKAHTDALTEADAQQAKVP